MNLKFYNTWSYHWELRNESYSFSKYLIVYCVNGTIMENAEEDIKMNQIRSLLSKPCNLILLLQEAQPVCVQSKWSKQTHDFNEERKESVKWKQGS